MKKLNFYKSALLSALILTACYAADHNAGTESDGGIERDTDGETSTDTDTDTDTDMDSDVDGDYEDYDRMDCYAEDYVRVPDAGVPADVGAICEASADPVISNNAARVYLSTYFSAQNPTPGATTGRFHISPDLAEYLINTPMIKVVEADPANLMSMRITNFDNGINFNAYWLTEPDFFSSNDMTIQANMEIFCPPSTPDGGVDAGEDAGEYTSSETGNSIRSVEAITYIKLCQMTQHKYWASSGEACSICMPEP